jgi:S-adenosylmethionine:tRNA ribosyltransferase-isomerase
VKLSDFNYDLPAESIAQFPAEPRDAARLLVHRVAPDETVFDTVAGLAEYLDAGDLLVMNDTRVLPARIFGKRSTGGAVEFLFVEPTSAGHWKAMARPAKKLKPGEIVAAADGALRVRMIQRCLEEDGSPSPLWEVKLEAADGSNTSVEDLLEEHGRLPLPPYIERDQETTDLERYQTIYACERGAVAAPTAGLHFTSNLLGALAAKGIESTTVTLHVGLGTFLPVSADEVDDHIMHSERYSLSVDTVCDIQACRARGGRVIAVGTTSVRVLESCSDELGNLHPGSGRTEIFIRPGYKFRNVDGLLTNFHLPKSTLLMLVSAFVGRERMFELYKGAIDEKLRFYSYGDAMLLLR